MYAVEMKEVDFAVLKEEFSRFTLIDDGTMLRAKLAVRKIFFHPQKTPEGYPAAIAVDTTNIISATVPQSSKRSSPEPWNPQLDRGEQVEFNEQKIEIQEYMTLDGFRITVKPILTKVLKYSKFNEFGEPIYGLTMQAITNIEKIKSTGKSARIRSNS